MPTFNTWHSDITNLQWNLQKHFSDTMIQETKVKPVPKQTESTHEDWRHHFVSGSPTHSCHPSRNIAALCHKLLNQRWSSPVINIPSLFLNKKPETRSPAVAKIADCTGCQWPSRSSKVNNFYVKGVCHFLLVINSNPGTIFHHFRDTATYGLKLDIENCSQTTSDGDMVTIDSL